MRQEMAKQTKMRETIQKKFHQMEDQKSDVEVQRETLRAQIAALEKGTVWIGTFFYCFSFTIPVLYNKLDINQFHSDIKVFFLPCHILFRLLKDVRHANLHTMFQDGATLMKEN